MDSQFLGLLLGRHLNGQESFSISTIPGPDLAGQPGRCKLPWGEHTEKMSSASTSQQAAAVLPSAVARLQPSPLQSCTNKRAKRQSPAVEHAVDAHTDGEFTQQAS